MPPRLSRPSTNSSASANPKTNKRKVQKSQKRALNAFTAAQHAVADIKVRGHRLGELEPERGPKRRRVADDEEDNDDEDEEREGKRSRGAEEDEDVGSDSSGNEWRMGGPIGEDSDSSLDSDEAFGSSDEERFEGFTFRGSSSNKTSTKKKSKPVKRAKSGDDMDLDEDVEQDQEEDDDDFGDEGVDLATMLDNPVSDEDDDESGDEGDTEEDDDDAASDTSLSEAESDVDGAKISKLQDLVASLEGNEKRRTASRDNPDAHESQQPSDYGITTAQKLKISDLLPTVTDPGLRKSLKVLTADKPAKRAGIPGKLAAPLPKRQQDRLDRTAATAKAKEELEKWQDTVIQNRRAEHLHFPLADPNASEPMGKNTLTSVTHDKPRTDLEATIQTIMEESGLSAAREGEDEARIAAAEELQMKEVPIEEVMARRAALRKARELLFREEIKAKRIKKIKSKSYRRVHRRERERQAEKERALMGEDELEDDKEVQDRRRAEERMGTKHRESKWAKGMKKAGRTVWDDDAREGVVEMARRHEDLSKRIEGKEVREDGDSDFSDDGQQEEDSDFNEGSDAERSRLSRQLNKIDVEEEAPKKGIAAMAFMRRAEAARKKQNDQTIAELRRELAGEAEDGSGSERDQDGDATLGRMVFGPKPTLSMPLKQQEQRQALEEPEDSAAEDDENDAEIIVDRAPEDVKSSAATAAKRASKRPGGLSKSTNQTSDVTKSQESNEGWLAETLTKTIKPKKNQKSSQKTFVPENTGAAVTANGSSGKKDKKQSQQQVKAKEGSAPDTSGWTVVTTKSTASSNNNDADSSSDEAQNPMLSKQEEAAALRSRAFAGDDVELAFADEKTGQMSDEDEKTLSTHLPGWGAWAGTGLTKAVRKRNAKHKHNPLFKTKVDGVRAADRRDAKLENVIISEARQRKGRKYLATQLPHEFERKEQYERSLRVPIGPEWTTKETFQRNTKPRITVAKGNIEAIKRPLV